MPEKFYSSDDLRDIADGADQLAEELDKYLDDEWDRAVVTFHNSGAFGRVCKVYVNLEGGHRIELLS